jgi:hypothetical protein
MKSAEGLLPTTPEITPYILERDGLQQAIVLDSPGYGGLMHDKVPDALNTITCSPTNGNPWILISIGYASFNSCMGVFWSCGIIRILA